VHGGSNENRTAPELSLSAQAEAHLWSPTHRNAASWKFAVVDFEVRVIHP